MVIKPEAIPQFSGDLGAVESHAAALKSAGGAFRTTGQNVHSTWQGLSAFYEAPEAARLFGATVQVKTGSDAVAGDIEEVGAALAQYAATVRPIADRLTALRGEAQSFEAGIKGDDDWREDGDKVNKNNELIRQVDTQVAALMAAERETANRINRLYGGTQWSVNDGSEKPNAYGFDAGQLPGEADRPWGSSEEKDEPWYVDTWNAVWSGGKGLIVDGLWGDIKGLWGLINVFDWETFSSSWGGLWTLTGGLIFDTENSLKAWKEFGKSFLAWDEWSKDPARAFGNVLYNVVTLPLAAAKIGTVGKAGKGAAAGADAGKAADAARAGDVAGDVGRVADVGKLTDDFGRVADVGRADQLPTVGDLARQIDAVLGDAVKADPVLELALKQADDIAASADRAKAGDDLVGRGEQPPARVEEPALVGAGRGGGNTGVDLPRATGHGGGHDLPPAVGRGGGVDLPPSTGRGGGVDDLGGLGDTAGRVGDDVGDAGRGVDDAAGGNGPDEGSTSTPDGHPGRDSDGVVDPSVEAPDRQRPDSDGPGGDGGSPGRYEASDLTATGMRDKQYGFELFRDADGKLHFDGDRDGTNRDIDGDLRQKGRFATEDNPHVLERNGIHGVPDLATQRAYVSQGDTPLDAAVRDAVSTRNDVVAARGQLWDTHLGPIAEKLKEHGVPMTRNLSEGRLGELYEQAAPYLSRAELLRLEKYGNEFASLANDLNAASARVGEAGGALVAAKEFPDYRTITAGDGTRGTPGNLDRTLISADNKSFIAIEEKGVGSALGERWVENPANPAGPKILAKQMSPEYLREMLQIDNKLGPILQSNPELRAALQNIVNGTTQGTIRYIHVHTSETGLVTATDYIVDSARLGPESIRLTGSD